MKVLSFPKRQANPLRPRFRLGASLMELRVRGAVIEALNDPVKKGNCRNLLILVAMARPRAQHRSFS
jgi:hypothetical protein